MHVFPTIMLGNAAIAKLKPPASTKCLHYFLELAVCSFPTRALSMLAFWGSRIKFLTQRTGNGESTNAEVNAGILHRKGA